MSDDRNRADITSRIPWRGRTGPRSRRGLAGLLLLVVLGLAASSLTSCQPAGNRQVGLATFAAAGANHETIVRVDCIMYRESRYQNAVSHRNPNGSHDAGLFQINSIHVARWLKVTGTDYWKNWANPFLNARVAVSLWKDAGLAPWGGGCKL